MCLRKPSWGGWFYCWVVFSAFGVSWLVVFVWLFSVSVSSSVVWFRFLVELFSSSGVLGSVGAGESSSASICTTRFP